MTDNLKIDSIEELTRQLKQIVDIQSCSDDGEGNDKVIDIVEKQLKAIGMTTKRIQHEHHKERIGSMLCAEVKGKAHPEKFITMLAHSDTVHAFEEFKGFTMSDDKTKGYGPGVIDCKGGIIVAAAALKAYLAQNPNPNFSIRFIISTTEETGSRDFHEHILKYGKETVAALGFEPSQPDGSVVHGRSGNRWYKFTCQGRKAHSGRAPKDGANAAVALAIKAMKLTELTDFSKNTTVTPTHIQSGRPNYNTVPEFGELFVDTRFESLEEDKRLETEIENLFHTIEIKALSDGFSTKFEMEITDYSPALMMSLKHRPVLKKYLEIVSEIEGKKVKSMMSHGSADVNSLWHEGMFFVGGAGAVGSGMHTPDEMIELSSLSTRALAAARTIVFAEEYLSTHDDYKK